MNIVPRTYARIICIFYFCLQGEKGDRGQRGRRGKTGPPGPMGPAGTIGAMGDIGLPGWPVSQTIKNKRATLHFNLLPNTQNIIFICYMIIE